MTRPSLQSVATRSYPDEVSSSPPRREDSHGLADRLQEGTRDLHVRAERSGIIAGILRGRASRTGYTLLLRNLLPAYDALEGALEARRGDAALVGIARPEVYRRAALEADLEALAGHDWRDALPVLPAGAAYGRRVREANERTGGALLGHAYTRYLGDLNGGRIVQRLLRRSLDLGPACLSFFAYPGVGDLASFGADYRTAFDAAERHVDVSTVIDEARAAFRLNIAVSTEVEEAVSSVPD